MLRVCLHADARVSQGSVARGPGVGAQGGRIQLVHPSHRHRHHPLLGRGRSQVRNSQQLSNNVSPDGFSTTTSDVQQSAGHSNIYGLLDSRMFCFVAQI